MYVTKHAGSYVLAVCIASGDLGSRVNRVWYTNGDFQVAARGYHGKASFHSTGSNDFSVPDGEVLRMGGETDAGNFEERVAFGTNGTNSFGPRNSGTWTATIEDNVVRGAGNVSPTTAVGTFERIGNIVVISMSISNIDITGLAVGNAYIHGVALSPAPADSNFTLSAVVDSPIAVVYSDINRTDGTLEMNAMVDSDGYITLREARDDATNLILDTDRLDGADIRMTLTGTHNGLPHICCNNLRSGDVRIPILPRPDNIRRICGPSIGSSAYRRGYPQGVHCLA